MYNMVGIKSSIILSMAASASGIGKLGFIYNTCLDCSINKQLSSKLRISGAHAHQTVLYILNLVGV